MSGLALALTAGLRALPLHSQTDEAWGLASIDHSPTITSPEPAGDMGKDKAVDV